MDFCLLLKTWVKNLLIVLKEFKIDAIKTASKRAIQKTAEGTGDLIVKKIADKITSVSKKSTKKIENGNPNNEIETPTKIHISINETANY